MMGITIIGGIGLLLMVINVVRYLILWEPINIIFNLILAILYFCLIKRMGWARVLLLILNGLVAGALVLVTAVMAFLDTQRLIEIINEQSPSPLSKIVTLIVIIYLIVFVYYFTRPKVKERFKPKVKEK